VIYLDTSALITLISGRPYATELRDFLADQRCPDP
jgi:predicted nucleic acid-binding protein